LICYNHGHVWLKNKGASPIYLIEGIKNGGGNFMNESDYIRLAPPNGVPCVGGANFQGGARFGSVEAAVCYLKQYFTVKACDGNSKCNQPCIDKL
jgi:hypothetical protein